MAVVSVRFQIAPSAASVDTLSEGYPGQAIVNSSGIFLGSTRLMFIECAKLACTGSDLTFLFKTQAPPLGSDPVCLAPCSSFQLQPTPSHFACASKSHTTLSSPGLLLHCDCALPSLLAASSAVSGFLLCESGVECPWAQSQRTLLCAGCVACYSQRLRLLICKQGITKPT